MMINISSSIVRFKIIALLLYKLEIFKINVSSGLSILLLFYFNLSPKTNEQ